MSNGLETSNLLLARLDSDTAQLLRPHLSRVPLEREQRLATPGEQVETIYFPEGGIASVVAVDGSARTEVGLIGREGMTGLGALLGETVAQFEIYMQVNGSTALTLPLEQFQRALEQSSAFRDLLGRYALHFLLQVSYAVVSCSQHLMEARLARWLLMCHDRLDGNEIALTHEYMATMISAQRSGVTVTLHTLEGAGMIRSTRGLVTIRDREKLVELAGASYGHAESRYRALIGPFGKSAAPEADEPAWAGAECPGLQSAAGS